MEMEMEMAMMAALQETGGYGEEDRKGDSCPPSREIEGNWSTSAGAGITVGRVYMAVELPTTTNTMCRGLSR